MGPGRLLLFDVYRLLWKIAPASSDAASLVQVIPSPAQAEVGSCCAANLFASARCPECCGI